MYTEKPGSTQRVYKKTFSLEKHPCSCQFEVGRRNITIEAGNKILTEKRLYHNRPDITVKMTNPTQIFIFEIAISHIQNYREQEKLKHIRYAVNSVTKLTNSKITNISRDLNLVSELEQIYRCPVHLGVFVVGCFGEVIKTETHTHFTKLML